MDWDTTLIAGPDVLARRLGEETILINLRTERTFALNRTGSRFWELLQPANTLDGIRRQLLGEFDVAPDALSEEIRRLAAQLAAEGLVEPYAGE